MVWAWGAWGWRAGGSVTRPADVILLPVPAFPTEYSLFAQLIPVVPTSTAAAQNIIQADAGSDTQRYVIRRSASTGALRSSLVGGTGGSFAPAVTLAADQPYKIAGAVAAGSQACSANGGTPGTASAAVLPTLPTQIRIGAGSSTSENFNGYISRVALINKRLTDAELQAITT